MEQEVVRSCIDCGVVACRKSDGKNPPFCVGTKAGDRLDAAIAEYDNGSNRQMMEAAAAVEAENYCKATRVEDTINFAKKMGFQKIGIATCAGLLNESRTLAQILRKHGFEVFGICCKAGEYRKEDLGFPEAYNICGKNMCNPILQAQTLNEEKTDMNIIMGLCVGHDMLFSKYSQAPVTTLVAKDRVLAHNPVGALYQVQSYYRTKLEP